MALVAKGLLKAKTQFVKSVIESLLPKIVQKDKVQKKKD